MKENNTHQTYKRGFKESVNAIENFEREENNKKVKEMEVIISLHQQLVEKSPHIK